MPTAAPGPGTMVDGNEPAEIHGSAAVMDVRPRVPPPVFWIESVVDCGDGLAAGELNESSCEPVPNCGGAEVMVMVTVTFCELPEQALDVQVTVTVPVYGEPEAVSVRAALVSAMESAPGVLLPPVTLSHGAVVAVVKFRIWLEMLEVTLTALPAGGADVPAVRAKDTLAVESTRSGALGRMATDMASEPVLGGVAESATPTVKLKLPLA